MELNLIGLCCSQPHLTVYSKLRKMKDGDKIKIITDDFTIIERDILPLVNFFKCKYSVVKDEDKYIIYVEK
ncbi:sulfurtransferase TusA family protein [Sulfolobus sp. S-194]|uniref:sulfurtransferase TusA family protein n=1 Tax=Sulfolobus sp. S-194 TaxID=2512240 RepID=UPI001436F2EB|nr:sulfurtransferase TusA family protein [Sulfolobus sp. S-194]QIW23729.1 sulfurtransferase TusA family protein [Sulfolobus sp. S-194]